jgi:hypothetical protein
VIPPRFRPRPFELVLLVFGLLLITRYAWVMDDAFIYARYADNAVLMKLGLVYNQGEYVEGFSSPFWMLWVLAWRAIGLSLWTIFLGSGYLGFVVMWWVLVRLDLALAPGDPPSDSRIGERINFPLAFLAVSYPVTAWFTAGMETSVIQACAAGYALFLVDPRSRPAQLLVGLAPLVRPELAAPLVIAILYVWIRTRRAPTLAIALGVGLNLAWLGFRVYYYADLLPNTFYLKDASDTPQGLRYLVNAFHSYYIEVILAGVALLSWAAARRGDAAERAKLGPRMMMWVASLPVILYVVRIGGDAIHYRYLAFPFCLCVCSSAGVLEAWWIAKPRKLAFNRYATAFAGVVAATSFSLQPPQRDRSRHAIVEAGDPHKVDEISDPGRHRRREHLRLATQIDPHRAAKLAAGEDPESFEYQDTAVLSWCAKAYVEFDRRVINGYGLTDPFLARMTVAELPGDRPGHMRGVTHRAEDLARIYKRADQLGSPGPGMMRAAVENNYDGGGDWVENNLAVIETIERKAFNLHDWSENLALAFGSQERIQVAH